MKRTPSDRRATLSLATGLGDAVQHGTRPSESLRDTGHPSAQYVVLVLQAADLGIQLRNDLVLVNIILLSDYHNRLLLMVISFALAIGKQLRFPPPLIRQLGTVRSNRGGGTRVLVTASHSLLLEHPLGLMAQYGNWSSSVCLSSSSSNRTIEIIRYCNPYFLHMSSSISSSIDGRWDDSTSSRGDHRVPGQSRHDSVVWHSL